MQVRLYSKYSERSVKPSAQPALARTQPLPPPAKTARLLRILALAGRFLLVTPCIKVCHCASMRCGVHGRIADGVRAGRAVGDTVGFPRTATDGGRAVPVPASHAALSRALALRRGCGGWRLPGVYHEGSGGACVPTCCPNGAWQVDVRDYAGRRRPGGAGPGWLRRDPRGRAAERGGMACVAGGAARCGRCRAVRRPDGPAGSACLRGCPSV